MTATRVKRCAEPGCKALIQDRLRYCSIHRTHANKRPGRIKAHEAGYGKRWEKFSENYRKSQPFCVRCEMPGHLVDHILPADIWPDLFYDFANVQTLCHPCHASKTSEDKARTWPHTAKEIETAARIVVCGPPGSGKSTFARQRAVDFRWDADAICDALGIDHLDRERTDLIVELRTALERYLANRRSFRFVVIVSMRDVARRVANRVHAALVEMQTRAEVCKERIARRETDVERLCGVVDEYFRRWG